MFNIFSLSLYFTLSHSFFFYSTLYLHKSALSAFPPLFLIPSLPLTSTSPLYHSLSPSLPLSLLFSMGLSPTLFFLPLSHTHSLSLSPSLSIFAFFFLSDYPLLLSITVIIYIYIYIYMNDHYYFRLYVYPYLRRSGLILLLLSIFRK